MTKALTVVFFMCAVGFEFSETLSPEVAEVLIDRGRGRYAYTEAVPARVRESEQWPLEGFYVAFGEARARRAGFRPPPHNTNCRKLKGDLKQCFDLALDHVAKLPGPESGGGVCVRKQMVCYSNHTEVRSNRTPRRQQEFHLPLATDFGLVDMTHIQGAILTLNINSLGEGTLPPAIDVEVSFGSHERLMTARLTAFSDEIPGCVHIDIRHWLQSQMDQLPKVSEPDLQVTVRSVSHFFATFRLIDPPYLWISAARMGSCPESLIQIEQNQHDSW